MTRTVVLAGVLALLAPGLAAAQTPSWTPPPENQRCPSKWGAGDERGSMNHQKPEAVLKAAKIIKTGETFELGHVLGPDMAISPTRRFDVHTKRTFMNPQTNKRGSNEEIVVGEIGQVGTQFDAFPHQTIDDDWYNCAKASENATRSAFTKYGVHTVGQLFTRGVMIDVAGFKGVEILPDNYEITVEDLEAAMKKQNTAIEAGDAVLINTGWGKLHGKDNARYRKSCPGIGVKAAQWLIAKDPMLLGSDNWPVEVSPGPDPLISLPVHQLALVVNGVHLLESVRLENLAARQVYEFAFVMQPLKIQGGTGSTVAPVAIR